MTKVSDICAFIEQIAPLAMGNPTDEYGLIVGDPGKLVRRGGVCWLPDSRVLARMEAAGIDMVVSHEHLWLRPQRHSPWYSHEAALEDKVGQIKRRAIYERTGMAALRLHSPWDAKPEVGVRDQCARWLGLGSRLAGGKYTGVYGVDPITLGALTARINHLMPDGVPARLFGPADRVVSRVGLAYGGLGGNQINIAEELQFLGAEVIVFGDLIEEIALPALELDIPVIETLHGLTEEPGMRSLMRLLAERFTDVDWRFFESGAARFFGP